LRPAPKRRARFFAALKSLLKFAAPTISLSVKDSGGLTSTRTLNFVADENFALVNDSSSLNTSRLVVQP
jgi:hypothetical protein